MHLTFINHASFMTEHGDVRLVCDPWLSGRLFTDAWDLLSPTRFTPEDFASVTHIWLSHEHPDHFSPATLRSIPPEVRARITVLFQSTIDRKVPTFCGDLGFAEVIELDPGRWYNLAPDVRVLCQPHRDGDSWLAIEAGDVLQLNINDCKVYPEDSVRIRKQIGRSPDVMLTQYSYAAWNGNAEETHRRREYAAAVLEAVVEQCQVLQPKWVIPFASFVWFCHEENRFMNLEMNSIEQAVRQIEAHTDARPVVLYPADQWTVGEEHDSSEAIAQYMRDFGEVLDGTRPSMQTQPKSFFQLVEAGRSHRLRLKGQHGLTLRGLHRLGQLRPVDFWVSDRGEALRYSLRAGIERVPTAREDCALELASDSLAMLLENLFGGDTLMVNGRFRVLQGERFRDFHRFVVLGDLANHGLTLRGHLTRRALTRIEGRARSIPVVGRLLGEPALEGAA